MFAKINDCFKKYKQNTLEISKQNIINSNNKTQYFLKNWFLIPITFAIIFSLPLYVNIFTYLNNVYFPYINAILGLLAIFTFLNADKKFRFLFGFFVGILWFYWVGLSFRFTEAPYFMYITIIFMGVVYGIVFWFGQLFNNIIYRSILLGLMSYLIILDFDWFVPDAIFAFSIFKVDKISFIIIVAVITIISIKRLRFFRFFAMFLLIFIIDFNAKELALPKFNMYLTQTDISQDLRWKGKNLSTIIQYNFSLIENAINNGYKIVVLPETAFPIALNIEAGNITITNKLLELSHKIVIIAGAIRIDNFKTYNSTYIFQNGNYTFADKVFLAPFGEYMPIPAFAVDLFSKVSGIVLGEFDVNDFVPRDINADNNIFRNAICYEATKRQIYADNPKFIIATSNNGWFTPSLEPIIQMTLIKYYARIYKTIVYHSANASKSGIITPSISLDFFVKSNHF